ncbi:hypothetical protein MHU86_14554 [Fragilaria crotonensis]|nr:hypothetical protein MHU86_14554 [Fragilaria crotonensis]
MYVRISGGTFAYCRRENAQCYQQTSRTVRGKDLPTGAIPVETEDEGYDRWKITHKTAMIPTQRQPTIATFADYVHSLEAWEADLLQHTELIADAYTICLDLQEAFVVAGSDGSEKYGNAGAFGWTLSNMEGEHAATGMGPSRGHVMDSYRAECSGMLSILRFLIRLAEFTAMDGTWTGIIGTDSQSMLDTIFGRGDDNSPAARKEPMSLQATRRGTTQSIDTRVGPLSQNPKHFAPITKRQVGWYM